MRVNSSLAFSCRSLPVKICFSILLDVVLIEVSLEVHYFFGCEVVLVCHLDHHLVVVELSCEFLTDVTCSKSARDAQNAVHHDVLEEGKRTFADPVVADYSKAVKSEEAPCRVLENV